MAIELLTNEHREKVQNAFKSCNKEIAIISPYLSYEPAKFLADVLQSKKTIQCHFITRFEHRDFLGKANTTSGLRCLLEAGTTLFAVKKLHTKLYLIDDHTAILGSANFTTSGLQSNQELSLYIENEPDLIDNLWGYFLDLAAICAEQNKFIIEKELADEEKRLKEENKKVNPTQYEYSFGAVIKDESKKQENAFDQIQNFLNPNVKTDSHCWIKFEASSRNRRPEKLPYTFQFEKGCFMTRFSMQRKPKRIHEGDWIYIAVHSRDKDGSPAPMIVGRAKCHAFRDTNVVEEDTQWPLYLELYEVERLKGNVQDGISLYEMVNTLKTDTYVHTQSSDIPPESVKRSHRQQAYLGLTEQAQQYLEQLFMNNCEPYLLNEE